MVIVLLSKVVVSWTPSNCLAFTMKYIRCFVFRFLPLGCACLFKTKVCFWSSVSVKLISISCICRRTTQEWEKVSETPTVDGHHWRKYGQKEILKAKYSR